MLSLYLLGLVLKQARGSCFVFPREFSSLFRVSRGRFGLLRLLSCGDLEALLCNHRIRGSVTALAQS